MEKFDVNTTRKTLVKALNRFNGSTKKVALLGTLRACLDILANEAFCQGGVQESKIDYHYFIDISDTKTRKKINKVPVVSLAESYEVCKECVILLCENYMRIDSDDHYRKIYSELKKKPIDGTEVTTFWSYYYCLHRFEVLKVFDMLDDDLSKMTYAHMIMVRMALINQEPEFVCPNPYFNIPIFAEPDGNEVFVDCGAFVGDTLEAYLIPKLGIFKKYYAFEPIKETYAALGERVRRIKKEWSIPEEKIQLVNAGIGNTTYQVDVKIEKELEGKGTPLSDRAIVTAEKVDSEGIPVYSLDDFFTDEKVSFIKADIESFEWKMLEGSEKVIKRDMPKLAICIYHTPADMFRIPLKIKQLCPEYKLYVRQHAFRIPETVLYATIEQKRFLID